MHKVCFLDFRTIPTGPVRWRYWPRVAENFEEGTLLFIIKDKFFCKRLIPLLI
jgi:hypothetical protein